jgi:hypothetical protein
MSQTGKGTANSELDPCETPRGNRVVRGTILFISLLTIHGNLTWSPAYPLTVYSRVNNNFARRVLIVIGSNANGECKGFQKGRYRVREGREDVVD